MDPFRLLIGLSLAQGFMAWGLGRIQLLELPLFLGPALVVWMGAVILGRLSERAARPVVRDQVRALRRAAERAHARTESMRGQVALDPSAEGHLSPTRER